MPNLWGADPTKDIQELFGQLDSKFFQGKMKKNGVLLEWNEEASSTAGYCYQLNDDVKGTKRCYIVLNKPLLKLRSRNDVVDTLLVNATLYMNDRRKNNFVFFNFFVLARNDSRVVIHGRYQRKSWTEFPSNHEKY